MQKENYQHIIDQIKGTPAKLVVVSKTRSLEQIRPFYENGQRMFGENRVSELVEKQAALPKDIEWHLIGHLQSKKVKHIASFVALIHSVDSLRLLEEINKQAEKNDRKIPVLLQFKIAQEESKYGLKMADLAHFQVKDYPFVIFKGVMGMASFVSDKSQITNEFRQLISYFSQIKALHFSNNSDFTEISMGMSGDYEIALAEGSTMLRVGSLVF